MFNIKIPNDCPERSKGLYISGPFDYDVRLSQTRDHHVIYMCHVNAAAIRKGILNLYPEYTILSCSPFFLNMIGLKFPVPIT